MSPSLFKEAIKSSSDIVSENTDPACVCVYREEQGAHQLTARDLENASCNIVTLAPSTGSLLGLMCIVSEQSLGGTVLLPYTTCSVLYEFL